MERVVQAEILDGLPVEDPEARRSRRDLRLINFLMGNHRWLRRALRRHPGRPLLEIGAGDGGFLASLIREERERSGLDLAPRPVGLASEIGWLQADVFDFLEREEVGGIVAANLFLHHFPDHELRRLGKLLRGCEVLAFSEPHRSNRAWWQGWALFPLVNRVTRHDMMVSIRAGFRLGELPELLGLSVPDWEWSEQCTLRGAYRLLASRRR